MSEGSDQSEVTEVTDAGDHARAPVTPRRIELPAGVLAMRSGPGANCSSIGSVVDLLFGAAVVGGALYAAIVASMRDCEVEQVGAREVAPKAKEDAR